jgi:transcriptional regulator with XRE-family HTH domain
MLSNDVEDLSSVLAVSVEVGKRIRCLRLNRHMSQQQLGAKLGITFQQVQKYEKGKNRLSVTRLAQLAQALACPAMMFLPEMDPETGFNRNMFRMQSRYEIQLIEAFKKIEWRAQKAVVQLVEAMAGDEERRR